MVVDYKNSSQFIRYNPAINPMSMKLSQNKNLTPFLVSKEMYSGLKSCHNMTPLPTGWPFFIPRMLDWQDEGRSTALNVFEGISKYVNYFVKSTT